MSNINVSSFSQTNSWAMVHGVWLGLWGLLTLFAIGFSFVGNYWFGLISNFMFLGSPFFVYLLSLRFKHKIAGHHDGFSFIKGFSHTFLMCIYASLWLALGVYVFFAYIDNGRFFDAYELQLNSPLLQTELKRMGLTEVFDQVGGTKKFVNILRSVSPANYSSLIIYFTIIFGPFISLIIGWLLRTNIRKN